jgi:hypothetical protein
MTCVALFLIGSYTVSMRLGLHVYGLHSLGGGEDVGDVREVRECQWKSDLEELLRGVTTCVEIALAKPKSWSVMPFTTSVKGS